MPVHVIDMAVFVLARHGTLANRKECGWVVGAYI